MLSLEEIRSWADAITIKSMLKLIKFYHRPSKRPDRTMTQIVFTEGSNEYCVWIFPEFNIMYVDALQEGVEDARKLFRGPVSRDSLECISLILRRAEL